MQVMVLYPIDEASVIEFCNEFSDKKRDAKEWKWEFCDNPSVVMIAKEDAEVIGTQALLLMRLMKNQAGLLSGKSEETLVHPEYRGKGVFAQLYERLFDEANSRNVAVIWGFTSARKPFTRVGFGFADIGLNSYVNVISVRKALVDYLERYPSNLMGRAKLLIRLFELTGIRVLGALTKAFTMAWRMDDEDNYSVLPISSFTDDTDALRLEVSQTFPEIVTSDRNQKFMNWRIVQNPFFSHTILGLFSKGKLVGYAVDAVPRDNTRIKEIEIVDIMIHPKHLKIGLPILLKQMIETYVNQGLGSVRFRLMPCRNRYSMAVLRALRRMGFVRTTNTMPFVFRVMKDEVEGISTIDNWYVTGLMTEGVFHHG